MASCQDCVDGLGYIGVISDQRNRGYSLGSFFFIRRIGQWSTNVVVRMEFPRISGDQA